MKKRCSNKRKSYKFVMTIGRAGKRFSIFGLYSYLRRAEVRQEIHNPRSLRPKRQPLYHPLDLWRKLRSIKNFPVKASGSMELTWQGQTYKVGSP